MLGRWAGDTIEHDIAGMTREVFFDTSTDLDTIKMQRQAAQLFDQMHVIEEHLKELNQKLNVANAAWEKDAGPNIPLARLYAVSHASHVVHEAMPSWPSVLVVSQPPKQVARSKVHLSSLLCGMRHTCKTQGCNYMFGHSALSIHDIADLPNIKATKCDRCFRAPSWLEQSLPDT